MTALDIVTFLTCWFALSFTFAIAWWALRSVSRRRDEEDVRRGLSPLDLTGWRR